MIAQRSGGVEGAGGNREVSPLVFLRARRDLRAAGVQACLEKKGARGGKLRFPRATEPKAEEAA
jgi:hypothetical protein